MKHRTLFATASTSASFVLLSASQLRGHNLIPTAVPSSRPVHSGDVICIICFTGSGEHGGDASRAPFHADLPAAAACRVFSSTNRRDERQLTMLWLHRQSAAAGEQS